MGQHVRNIKILGYLGPWRGGGSSIIGSCPFSIVVYVFMGYMSTTNVKEIPLHLPLLQMRCNNYLDHSSLLPPSTPVYIHPGDTITRKTCASKY